MLDVPVVNLPSPTTSRGFSRAREVFSDVVIATALIWALPLLLAVVAVAFRLAGGLLGGAR